MRFLGLVFATLLVGTGACDSRPAESHTATRKSSLTVDRPEHDFGRVPIDSGSVETVFHIVNDGPDVMRLLSVSTSCGCTKALAEFADGSTVGSFDIPDDGDTADAGKIVRPGEAFRVRVEFDPAAHGPDGVGRLLREIVLATLGGSQTRLVITADVFRG